MPKQDAVAFGIAGLAVWSAATLFYAAFGGGLLEAAFWFYALNAFMVAAALTLTFQSMLRLTRTPRRRRLNAALAFSAPGLIGAALALASFEVLFPHMGPASAGRYGAFLAVGYLAVFAWALERGPVRKA